MILRTTALLSTPTAMVSLLCLAQPTFAQDDIPAPIPLPGPPAATAIAPPPAGPSPATVTAAVQAPKPAKAADDMTGSFGFGVGLLPGTTLVKPDTSALAIRYWKSDTLAITPRFVFSVQDTKGERSAWSLEPSAIASHVLFKGATTRLSLGGGIGLALGKNREPATAVNEDVHVGIVLPVELAVEHFFARWLAVGLATRFNFIDAWKQGDRSSIRLEVHSAAYWGSLFIYTD